jgi:hypothetical protein
MQLLIKERLIFITIFLLSITILIVASVFLVKDAKNRHIYWAIIALKVPIVLITFIISVANIYSGEPIGIFENLKII